MKIERNAKRRVIGKISIDTKGPPGVHMEWSGLLNVQGLTN